MALTQTQNHPPKVFIDSSVLIAAAISASGAARLLLTAGFLDQLTLAVSSDVFEEVATFDQKHFLNEGERISKARGIAVATPSDILRRIHQPS